MHVLGLALLVACAARPPQTSAPSGASAPSGNGALAAEEAGDDAAALEIIAQIEHALETWHASCPRANEHGLCVALEPVVSTEERCDTPVLGPVVVHARDPEMAATAQQQLAAAMDRAGCDTVSCSREVLDVRPKDAQVLHAYRHALANARIARVDAGLEEYFTLTLPEDLDLVVEEWKRDSQQPEEVQQYQSQLVDKERSESRLRAFLVSKQDLRAALNAELVMVKQYDDEEALLRAALRSMWMSLHFFEELTTSKIPATLDSPQMRMDYCRALTKRVTRTREDAVDTAIYCKVHAEQSGSDGVAARACRELLERLEEQSPADDVALGKP